MNRLHTIGIALSVSLLITTSALDAMESSKKGQPKSASSARASSANATIPEQFLEHAEAGRTAAIVPMLSVLSQTPKNHALMISLRRYHTELAKLLLENGAAIDVGCGNMPNHPLYTTVFLRNNEMLDYLLQLFTKQQYQLSPTFYKELLEHTITYNNPEAGKILIDFAARTPTLKKTMLAVINNYCQKTAANTDETFQRWFSEKGIAETFHQLTAEPTSTTELFLSLCDAGNTAVVQLMLPGIPQDIRDIALIIAINKSHEELFRLLMANGANIHAPQLQPLDFPLCSAVIEKQHRMVEQLLQLFIHENHQLPVTLYEQLLEYALSDPKGADIATGKALISFAMRTPALREALSDMLAKNTVPFQRAGLLEWIFSAMK